MILTTITVNVPAQREIDADLNEYGHISTKCRAQYGEAAVEAGAPDYEALDPLEAASDAIANILHWLNENLSTDGSVSPNPIASALQNGLRNFEAES